MEGTRRTHASAGELAGQHQGRSHALQSMQCKHAPRPPAPAPTPTPTLTSALLNLIRSLVANTMRLSFPISSSLMKVPFRLMSVQKTLKSSVESAAGTLLIRQWLVLTCAAEVGRWRCNREVARRRGWVGAGRSFSVDAACGIWQRVQTMHRRRCGRGCVCGHAEAVGRFAQRGRLVLIGPPFPFEPFQPSPLFPRPDCRPGPHSIPCGVRQQR